MFDVVGVQENHFAIFTNEVGFSKSIGFSLVKIRECVTESELSTMCDSQEGEMWGFVYCCTCSYPHHAVPPLLIGKFQHSILSRLKMK